MGDEDIFGVFDHPGDIRIRDHEEALYATRPWLLVMSGAMWLSAAFCALAAVAFGVMGLGAGEMIGGAVVGGLYVFMTLFAGGYGWLTSRQARAIRHFREGGGSRALQRFLQTYRDYWTAQLVITVMMVVLYSGMAVALVAAGSALVEGM